jgi:hypothetical protein
MSDIYDTRYAILVPKEYLKRCRSTFEWSLLTTICDIAGEYGECSLATEDLAVLSMMSRKQVERCRDRLLQEGVIVGEKRKDPGQGYPLWHFTVPGLAKDGA